MRTIYTSSLLIASLFTSTASLAMGAKTPAPPPGMKAIDTMICQDIWGLYEYNYRRKPSVSNLMSWSKLHNDWVYIKARLYNIEYDVDQMHTVFKLEQHQLRVTEKEIEGQGFLAWLEQTRGAVPTREMKCSVRYR